MAASLKRYLAQARDDDSGIAMITVIGVVVLMTILAVGAFFLARQSTQESVKVRSDTQAFQAANAGVDIALARMQANGYVPSDYPVTGSLSVGATYSATVTATANSEYLCTSVGHDISGSTSTVKVKFFYLNLWNMNLAAGTNNALGGGSVKGTTSVYGPFYVRGGVALGSNSIVDNGPFFIKGGDLTISGSGQVGDAGNLVDLYVTGAYPPLGSKGMYANSISQSVPDISLPLVDQAYLQSVYDLAKSESVDNVRGYTDSGVPSLESQGGNPASYTTVDPPNHGAWTRNKAPGAAACYKVIGADNGIGAAGAGTHGLTISDGMGNIGSWGPSDGLAGDGHYTLSSSDDFAFDDATNVLRVEGTVFIDGPLTINCDVEYVGNGAIVCNGNITIKGNFRPHTVGYAADARHICGLVTPTNIICDSGTDNQGKDPTEPPDVAGAFFCSKDWSMSRNVLVKGSVLAGSISFAHANQHLVTDPNLPSYLPRSMPGAGQSILTKGAWVR